MFITHALVYGEARTHEHTVVTCTGASETTRLGGVAVGVTNRVRERLRRTTEIHPTVALGGAVGRRDGLPENYYQRKLF